MHNPHATFHIRKRREFADGDGGMCGSGGAILGDDSDGFVAHGTDVASATAAAVGGTAEVVGRTSTSPAMTSVSPAATTRAMTMVSSTSVHCEAL